MDNGSTDATAAVTGRMVRRLAGSSGCCGSLTPGKGLAVREGFLPLGETTVSSATPTFRCRCAEITKFLPPELPDVEVAIGYAEGPGRPPLRRASAIAISWAESTTLLVRSLVLPGIQDSQCGFKCLRADIGRRLAVAQTIPWLGFRCRAARGRPSAGLPHR